MIKDNQRHFNRLHVVLDATVTVAAYLLAWWLKFKSGILSASAGVLPVEIYMGALVVIIPVYVLLYYAFNLYTPKRVQGRRLEAWNIFKANTVGLVIIFSVLFLLDSTVVRYALDGTVVEMEISPVKWYSISTCSIWFWTFLSAM